ncbi:hypothetical protein OIV83_004535 [Microbotryomycetes sp. JL201]|nr:hypothetical protein OIV83_004535 [Microbotryomycetes sp. JL201]
MTNGDGVKKPTRHMIARGAATLRMSSHTSLAVPGPGPECIKSAERAKQPVCCTYEGQFTVAATRDHSPPSASNAKRSREPSIEDADDDVPATRRRKSGSASGGGQRVDQLVSRITELENRLKEQAERQLYTQTQSSPLSTLATSYGTSAYTAPTSIPSSFISPDLTYSVVQKNGHSRQGAIRPSATLSSVSPSLPMFAEPSTSASSSASPPFGLTSVPFSSYVGPPLSAPSPGTADLFEQLTNSMNPTSTYSSAIPNSAVRLSAAETTDKADLFATAMSAPLMTGGSATSDGAAASFDFRSNTSPGSASLGYGSNNSGIPSPDDFDPSLYSLFYPGWPLSLPPPPVLRHLVIMFFNRATVPASIFSQSRFLASLELPPTSSGFPETALLHAMCGYVVVNVSEETLRSVTSGSSYWVPEQNPRMYHYKQARRSIEAGIAGRRNIFQVVQASVLVCYIAYQQAAFTDLWMLSGQMMRLLTPLQLNHIPPFDYAANKGSKHYPEWKRNMRSGNAHGIDEGLVGPVSGKATSLMPPATDLDEYLERVRTFWAAFAIDRHVSSATDWSQTLDELDISTHLPCETLEPGPELAIDRLLERIHALSIKSADLFEPPKVPIGSFGLYIKGNILLGRVNNFLQRLPQYTKVPPGYTCATYRDAVVASAQFQELDLMLAKFRTTMSSDFFNTEALGFTDGYMMASAYCLPHVATLLLHEPMVDEVDRSPENSLNISIRSATCVVRALTLLYYSTSNDCFGIDPFLWFTWSVVGRCLVRDYAVRRRWSDDPLQLEKAELSRDLAWQCLMAVRQCAERTKGMVGISVAIAQNLTKLIQNPEMVVPFYNVEDKDLAQFALDNPKRFGDMDAAGCLKGGPK